MEPKAAGRAEKVEEDGFCGGGGRSVGGRWSEKTRERAAGWMIVKLCDELTGDLIIKSRTLWTSHLSY